MDHELWAEVDDYFAGVLVGDDPALEGALAASREAGLPAIAVSAAQGKLLNLLVRLCGARRVLEVGTLGGYSAIWMARALPPGGELVTLEADPRHAEVARSNLDRAGLGSAVDVRLGAALATLPELTGPFDLAFIDADKENNPEYFRWALRLSRPGGVIVVDNVVRAGAVVHGPADDPSVRGVRELHDLIAAEPRVDATALQTVGAKGYDGFTLALVTS
ncbi:Predicted O-methyltransferase YrrM [Amycolatopsis arida]|uniref:Predicted O-methyltransferase YrrM n=1 Tax=Amycolatopsis arida TaxID=587909 RepID=A0A1I5KXR0_9PSEU|nr:O-methyltransferase [Amycolatopsis arida]TDX85876.1 putative O-methyltransferase YrrM [Amycolatopsis arida]SFO89864.1 Predicted O-methyltransferase YrrM [Amycolatopsis arida]